MPASVTDYDNLNSPFNLIRTWLIPSTTRSTMLRRDKRDGCSVSALHFDGRSNVLKVKLIDHHVEEPATLRLRLQTGHTERRVNFEAGTVDNEHLNKKKSKCCCIFKKRLEFGESSSEDEDECDHCFGHVEKKKKKKSKDPHDKLPESQ